MAVACLQANNARTKRTVFMRNRTTKSTNTVWQRSEITRQQREKLNGHTGAVVWFTGLCGSGKSTLAHALEAKLYQLAVVRRYLMAITYALVYAVILGLAWRIG